MAINVETYFLVTITPEGGFVTYTVLPEEELTPARQATTADVFAVSKQIVQEIEQSILVDRIVSSVTSALAPQKPETISDKVKDALKDRGIDPESVTVAE
jgi:hypothetical protein